MCRAADFWGVPVECCGLMTWGSLLSQDAFYTILLIDGPSRGDSGSLARAPPTDSPPQPGSHYAPHRPTDTMWEPLAARAGPHPLESEPPRELFYAAVAAFRHISVMVLLC